MMQSPASPLGKAEPDLFYPVSAPSPSKGGGEEAAGLEAGTTANLHTLVDFSNHRNESPNN